MVRLDLWKTAMNRTALAGILLVVFGLVPIVVWIAMALNLEPSGLGRSIGRALLVVLAPLPFGGALMILGAAFLRRTRRAGRIYATVGAAIVLAGVAFLSAVWMRRLASCGGPAGICTPELIEALAGFAYASIHGGLIALVWRGYRANAPASARGS